MLGLIFKNSASTVINARITFFMPPPLSHTIIAFQTKRGPDHLNVSCKSIFPQLQSLIGISGISKAGYPGDGKKTERAL
jgi:hypothetical protein